MENETSTRVDMLVEAAISCTDKEPAETYQSRLGKAFLAAAAQKKPDGPCKETK